MQYVILDTNVLLNCALVRKRDDTPEVLEFLFGLLRSANATLLVPEIIEAEFKRLLPRELDAMKSNIGNLKKELNKQFSGLPQVDRDRIVETVDTIARERAEAAERARQSFEKVLADKSFVHRIELSGEIVARSIISTLSACPPCRGNEPLLHLNSDSLIVSSLADFASRQPADPASELILCTEDTDFLEEPVREGQPRVVAASIVKSIGLPVRYVENLSTLPEELRVSEKAVDPSLESIVDDYAAARALRLMLLRNERERQFAGYEVLLRMTAPESGGRTPSWSEDDMAALARLTRTARLPALLNYLRHSKVESDENLSEEPDELCSDEDTRPEDD